ncbi:MAG TPA: 2-C-methyl-D-erythritol 2,4-cyclodiphosphate synthase, partial [Firmicutes bacterium]|nr:2-C-methyl-D-erythritol 2,4-cyclodiphosphate synthase [Bacillota bacterium]
AGASSIVLLQRVLVLLEQSEFKIGNLDITVMAQKPKLAPWKAAIKTKLAQVLFVAESQINLKATTTEGLGFVGREEGIAAQVVILLRSD